DRILKVKTLLNQIPQISEYESNLLLLKGMLYDINGDQENAQKYFRELSVKYPNSFWEAPLSLSLMKSNKYQEAINILEDQIKNKKGNYITFFYLGRAFSELGEWDKALSNFKFSFRLRGSNPELLFSLATAYLYSNKKFHFIYYRLKLAIKLLLLKDYSVAFNMLFKTILLLFFYLYFSFEEIICKITIGIPLLNKVTIKLFSPIKFYRATGNELFFYRRHYKFALKFYECYLKIDEKCSEFYDLIAQCYAMLGETKKAVEKINVALKFDPLNILYLSHKKVIETGKTPTIKTSVNLEITKQLAQKQFYKKN
ncbi:MAG: tetratricopeptide repeat protein, partial [Ignavibacteriaceae bacterium]